MSYTPKRNGHLILENATLCVESTIIRSNKSPSSFESNTVLLQVAFILHLALELAVLLHPL